MTGAAAAPAERGAPEADGRTPDALARAVFAALVLACFVAFFVTQRLKHTPTVVQRFELASSFSPPGQDEAISFIVARADRVTVAIIDERGDVVATLVRNHPVLRYRRLSLRWNGRRGTAHRVGRQTTARGHAILLPQTRGHLAPPGEYRVRVSLRSRDVPVLSPRTFKLVRP